MQVPNDFPRRTLAGFVGGAVPKFIAMKAEDGTYTTYVSDEEYEQAYDNAEDLAQQLKPTHNVKSEKIQTGHANSI